MLVVDSLSAQYGLFTALRGVSFEVQEGDLFGVLGSNGAGKTTILRAIAGLRPPAVTGSVTCRIVFP